MRSISVCVSIIFTIIIFILLNFNYKLTSNFLSSMETQPNKEKAAWEGDDVEESVWEAAVRSVREKDAAGLARKKQQEEEELRMFWEYMDMKKKEKKRLEDEAKEHERIWKEKWRQSDIESRVNREFTNRRNLDRIVVEAHLIREERAKEEEEKMAYHTAFDSVVQMDRSIREKEEVDEEVRKKKAKGEGAFSTQ